MKIQYVANAVRWFDKVNGNTYHSVNIQRCRDGKMLYCQFQYGYGDHYRQTALYAMAAAKWFPKAYRTETRKTGPLCFERENGYPIAWNVSEGLKRECVANGQAN